MELVELILSFLAEPSVSGCTVLGVGLVNFRKYGVKWLDNKAVKDTNATNLKIAEENNRTALEIAEKGHKSNDQSHPMTRAS